MASASRFSIFWFLMWAVAVIFVTSGVQATSQAQSITVKDNLVQEIENLAVIHQLNSGKMDSSGVGVVGETENSKDFPKTIDSHRTAQRSILSQR